MLNKKKKQREEEIELKHLAWLLIKNRADVMPYRIIDWDRSSYIVLDKNSTKSLCEYLGIPFMPPVGTPGTATELMMKEHYATH